MNEDTRADRLSEDASVSEHWTARHSKPIIFLILACVAVGICLAFTIPAEVNLFFSWQVDMFQTLELVNAALARIQSTLPPTAACAMPSLSVSSWLR